MFHSPAGLEVAAVDFDEPFPGEPPQPRIERHGTISEVVVQAPGGVGQGFLDDVGGIETGGQATVETDRDHLPQAVPMPGQQPLASLAITLAGAVEQFLGIERIRCHSPGPLQQVSQSRREGHGFFSDLAR